MIGLPSGTRVWIVAGHTDMRKGFDGLAAMVQTALAANPFCGHVFVFRGRRGDILKVLWFDGQGLMLLAKRLERGRFVWPQADSGSVSLTPAQLSMLLEGIDWRMPVRTHRAANSRPERTVLMNTPPVRHQWSAAPQLGTVDLRADHTPTRPTPSKRCCASSRSATPKWASQADGRQAHAAVAAARRAQYGRSSEQLDDPQIALIEGAPLYEHPAPKARAKPDAANSARHRPQAAGAPAARGPGAPPRRRPRLTTTRTATPVAAPRAAVVFARSAHDVSEQLEYVPARFKVIRHVRPKLACVGCEAIFQAAAPSRPIARGVAGPGLLANVLVSKYCDHIPLHRLSRIHARDGVCIDPSTYGGWVEQSDALLDPLVAALGRYALAGVKVHADDTPVPVLDPGRGRTKTGRLWVYVRDDRPAASTEPPAAWYRYSPNRKGEHPQDHLKDYSGILQADAYGGYGKIYDERACRRSGLLGSRATTVLGPVREPGPRGRAPSPIRRCSASRRSTRSRPRSAVSRRTCDAENDRPAPGRCWRTCVRGSQHGRRGCRRSRSWPRRSATRSRAGGR